MPVTAQPRGAWNAAASRPMTRGNVPTEAFIHATAAAAPERMTRGQAGAVMRSIQQFHMGPERGWSDIGYHFVVFPTVINGGAVFAGRPVDAVPAAQLGHNTGTLAIAVHQAEDAIAPRRARFLIEEVIRAYGPRVRCVGWHSQVTSTSCPGPSLRAAVPLIARALSLPVYPAHR